MSLANSVASETITQLNAARSLALNDPSYYPQIVSGVLPIIGQNATVELQQWGADFIAETVSSPVISQENKLKLGLTILDILKGYLEGPVEDTNILKSAVQSSASIYPYIFRHIINNPTDESTWQKMAAIKSNILRRMDSAAPGVRICCIKFVQRVVQTQTPGLISDPRRPEQNEISLALVPRDHPLIPPQNLEAETSGLLDRLLGILQEESSDALYVTATLNALGSLIRMRPSIANKIIANVLNFNPLKLANSPMTPRSKVMIKSMERTMRSLLLHVMKKSPENPLNPKIQSHLERIHRMRVELFDESQRKRAAPIEPTDGLTQAKRQRLGADIVPPLPPGPVSYAQLYTLSADDGAKNFDVQAIPIDAVVSILVPILMSIDEGQLNNAINAVRARYLSLSRTKPRTAADASAAALSRPSADDDDEYEPDFEPVEDEEQIVNKLDSVPPQQHIIPIPDINIGPFKLPQPHPLSPKELEEYSKGTVMRVFELMTALDEQQQQQPRGANTARAGFNRLAASNYDRDSWLTVITRLAARSVAGAEGTTVKLESAGPPQRARSIPDSIREALHIYVLEDFRRRIGAAIAWLTEEWYSERVLAEALRQERHQARQANGSTTPPTPTQPPSQRLGGSGRHYDKWMLKVLDGMLPYLDAKDKNVLIRFVSEIPALDGETLRRIKDLARDPERVGLAVNTIHYLILVRPPVREICLDALEDLWMNYAEAKSAAAKLLAKWRPAVLARGDDTGGGGEGGGGTPVGSVKVES